MKVAVRSTPERGPRARYTRLAATARSLGAVVLWSAVAFGCGDGTSAIHAPQDAATPGDAGQRAGAGIDERGPTIAGCDDLAAEARRAFSDARASLEVVQCEVADDCVLNQQDFYSDHDACWAGCSSLGGTPEYEAALKEIGGHVCAEFRDAGCRVVPAGCPALSPVSWMCVSAQCVAR